MKQLAILLTAVLLISALSGCVTVNFHPRGVGAVKGEGEMTETTWQVGDYTKVSVGSSAKVVYSSEPSDSVKISIQPNLAEILNVEVRSGTLYIDSDSYMQVDQDKRPVVYISNPNLEGLYVAGMVEMSGGDTITGESFELNVAGLCDIKCSVQVKNFSVSNAGAGSIQVSGEAERASIHISGAGSVDALALQAKDATINISGMADASISCSDYLEVDLSGMGGLTYRGAPRVSQHISGIGEVKQVS